MPTPAPIAPSPPPTPSAMARPALSPASVSEVAPYVSAAQRFHPAPELGVRNWLDRQRRRRQPPPHAELGGGRQGRHRTRHAPQRSHYGPQHPRRKLLEGVAVREHEAADAARM